MATRIAGIVIVFGLFLLPARSVGGVDVCGDGIRTGAEQCDDGNTANLDGCDSTCHFEQTHRVNELKLQFGTSTACTINAFGGAIAGSTAQSGLQTVLDTSVGDGTTSLLLRMLGLDDLSGTNDASIQVGLLNGVAIPPDAPAYDGHNDLDGWYLPAPDEVDAQGIPTSLLAGTVAGGGLNAGPGSARLKVNFSTPTLWSMSAIRLLVSTGASSTPLVSTGLSPGHLGSEHLDPALQSFATAGQPVGTAGGSLCANVSAESLRQTPLPAALVGCGSFNCTQCYTSANTLLDAVVGGCTISLLGQQLKPTQPDTSDPAAPAAGGGPPYVLSANASHVVATCKSQGATVDLTTCLQSAAYSTFFTFSSDRVIATTTRIFADGFDG